MIGSTILHYNILRKLGAGGMGVVYEALDTKLERNVALKFLADGVTHNPQAMERFAREAKAVSRLDHPNIGAVFALEHTNDQTFLSMAMYQGTTLAGRLENGRLNMPDALRIALEMARGLEHAHGQGVIHRDIKPANVMLAKMPNNNEITKILDFGLARLEDASKQLTRPGATTGTLLYMSPEQLSGKADAQSDIWAWGAVVYETLAGHTPFNVDGIGALLNAILNSEPIPLEQSRSDTPKILMDMVMQSLQKNPDDRPNSMTQIVANLETLLSSSGERMLLSNQNASVSLSPPPEKIVPQATPPALSEAIMFDNPSSWDNDLKNAKVIDTTTDNDTVTISISRRGFPWIIAIPILVSLAAATWFFIPRSPQTEKCEPLNTTGSMLDTAIKWAAPLIPLENCGSFGYGQGSAVSEYNGAENVKRQVLALLPGTVLVADNVQYPQTNNMRTMIGLKGNAITNTSYQGSGQQFQVGKGKFFTALYPSSLNVNTSGEAIILNNEELSNTHLTLNIYQVEETDTDIQRLDVTTSDEHTQNFVGALFGGKTAVFLGIGANANANTFNVNVPLGITRYIITGLTPGKSYDMSFEPDRGWNYITLKAGRSGTVNSAGILVLGEGLQRLKR
jgi:serine/threonine protein kinase